MGYWKSKVLPKIKKVFEKSGNKKAAAEACNSFDASKEEYNKELEEKKTELQPKVLEIYEASSTEIKDLVKNRTEAGIKKNSTHVTTFVEELVKIDFPSSKPISEAISKFGPAYVSAPIIFLFEKIAIFLPAEELTTEELKKEEKDSVEKIEEKKFEENISPIINISAEEKISADVTEAVI